MDSISIAGETVTAATALAGLILVYLGSVAASYGGYQPTERKSVKGSFQRRAWIAFVGLVLALIAAALGVLGKWLPNECVADAGTILLLVSFVWGVGIALVTTLEIS